MYALFQILDFNMLNFINTYFLNFYASQLFSIALKQFSNLFNSFKVLFLKLFLTLSIFNIFHFIIEAKHKQLLKPRKTASK